MHDILLRRQIHACPSKPSNGGNGDNWPILIGLTSLRDTLLKGERPLGPCCKYDEHARHARRLVPELWSVKAGILQLL